MVMIVLLKLAWICAIPLVIPFAIFFFFALSFVAIEFPFLLFCREINPAFLNFPV
jgi:hypothetical protein